MGHIFVEKVVLDSLLHIDSKTKGAPLLGSFEKGPSLSSQPWSFITNVNGWRHSNVALGRFRTDSLGSYERWGGDRTQSRRRSGITAALKTTFDVFTSVGADHSLERLTERGVGLITHQPSDIDELFITLMIHFHVVCKSSSPGRRISSWEVTSKT